MDGLEPVGCDGGSGKSADEGVGGRRRDALPPGPQIPNDGGNDSRKDDGQCDVGFVDGLRYCVGDAEIADKVFGNEERHKVETGSPYDGLERTQYLGRHDGGDGVGRVVESVDIVKEQCKYDDDNE